MIITDNGNDGSTIAREQSSGDLEDKIDKEEERRSGLISDITRIRPQQNRGINVFNEKTDTK